MSSEPFDDPELEDCMLAAVDRGEFSTIDEARADFLAGIDEAIAEMDAGGGVPIEVIAAELHERYANWPRAAE